MKNNLLISTITPSYRMEKYLTKFLDELPKQTIFNNIEVVLDHNEPTLNEIKLIKNFNKKYPGKIKHLIKKKVIPIGESMNSCIKNASGKYLSIWNIDDLRTPDSLEQQLLAFKKSKADVVYGNHINVSKFGSYTGDIVNVIPNNNSEYKRGMYLGPFFMFKKSILKKSGIFDEQLMSGADFDLAIRLSIHGLIKKINSNLGFYLNAGTGASTRPNSKQPIERTVIELRYGIYDKIDTKYLIEAMKYSIPYLKLNNKWTHIDKFIPNYKKYILDRKHLDIFSIKNKNKINFLKKVKKFFN